ncbi:MAG: putative LPS assembly protein LptD, partial [Chitinophagaceae bacterium]
MNTFCKNRIFFNFLVLISISLFSCKTKYVYFSNHTNSVQIDTNKKQILLPVVKSTKKNKKKSKHTEQHTNASSIYNLLDTNLTVFNNAVTVPKDTSSILEDILSPKEDINTTKNLSTVSDSILLQQGIRDSLNAKDTIILGDTISYKISKESIPDIIDHTAQDSMVWDLPNNMVYLYSKTKTKFQDIELDADKMAYNTNTNIATAIGKYDTMGKVVEKVKFTQQDQKYQSDSLEYSFKSQKGIINNTITQQSEMFVHSKVVKRIDTSAFFGRGGAFTTCSYDEPHFDFFTNKYKLIKDKVVVTGPIFPEFEGVMIPIPIPFGMFPLNTKRKGGIIIPSYTVDNQRGFGLLGGGYMLNLNQYFKATITGDFYTYLSWAVRMNSSYLVRYKFNGTFNFNYQDNRLGFPGDVGFSNTKTYAIQWAHTQDKNVDPNMTFSASVNFSSTQYNATQFYDPALGFNNQQSSSIALGYTFKYSPISMQLALNHNQNNLTRLYNFTLPNLNLNVTPINPFQKQNRVGSIKWYEKLSIG